MIINRIRIENFGHFHDFTLELTEGLNRLRGENEFGKSTLLEFVRRVLWGFPDGRRSQLNHYPARFNAGEYGGSLDVTLADGSRVTLERFGVRGALVARHPDGREEPGDEFLRKLTPVSEDCYRNVYAVTVDELTRLSSLDGEEIRGRLYGGAITGGDISLPALGKFLDERAKTLFKARSQATLIGTARREFRESCEKRDLALNELAKRPALERKLAELEEESRRRRAEADECSARIAGAELLLKAHPRYLELVSVERELAEMPNLAEVPESAALRAEELASRLAGIAVPESAESPRLELLAAEIALLDRELAARTAPGAPSPDDADIARAAELETRAAELAVPPGLSPSRRATSLVAGAVMLTSLILAWRFPTAAWAALPILTVGMGAVVVANLLALKKQRGDWLKKGEALAREISEFRSRWALTCPPQEFSATLASLKRRHDAQTELEDLRREQKAREAIRHLREELGTLCSSFNCADAAEVRKLARSTARKNTLRSRRAEISAALDALLGNVSRQSLENFDPAAERLRRDEERLHRDEAQRSVFAIHERAGALANELRHLPHDGEIEVLDSEVERARCELRRLVREYLVVRGCRTLLDAAVGRYERESQPEVLKRAAALFSEFTGGRYPRIYKSAASGELIACDAQTNLEKTFGALSRGTREELMLAMRLALIECTERDSEPLPVCFDDVGVDFDPVRLERVESAVENFARTRQVIWFSHS